MAIVPLRLRSGDRSRCADELTRVMVQARQCLTRSSASARAWSILLSFDAAHFRRAGCATTALYAELTPISGTASRHIPVGTSSADTKQAGQCARIEDVRREAGGDLRRGDDDQSRYHASAARAGSATQSASERESLRRAGRSLERNHRSATAHDPRSKAQRADRASTRSARQQPAQPRPAPASRCACTRPQSDCRRGAAVRSRRQAPHRERACRATRSRWLIRSNVRRAAPAIRAANNAGIPHRRSTAPAAGSAPRPGNALACTCARSEKRFNDDTTTACAWRNSRTRGIGAHAFEQLQECGARARRRLLAQSAAAWRASGGANPQAFVAPIDGQRDATRGQTLREIIEHMLHRLPSSPRPTRQREPAENPEELVNAAGGLRHAGRLRAMPALPVDEQAGAAQQAPDAETGEIMSPLAASPQCMPARLQAGRRDPADDGAFGQGPERRRLISGPKGLFPHENSLADHHDGLGRSGA